MPTITFTNGETKKITQKEEDYLSRPDVAQCGKGKLLDGTVVELGDIATITPDSALTPGQIAMGRGLERYINSTERNPIIDYHGHKVWYQGGKQPLEELAKYNR
jgi:hypothetical protein